VSGTQCWYKEGHFIK